MSIFVPEIAATYGALDSDAFADGKPASSAPARELARSVNRLLAQGEPLLQLIFDANIDGGGADNIPGLGYLTGFALNGQWRRFYQGPLWCPKKTTHRRAEVQITADVTVDTTILVQVATSGHPFDPYATVDDSNVIEMVGTGDFEEYAAEDIVLGDGSMEQVELFVQGDVDQELMAVGNYHAGPPIYYDNGYGSPATDSVPLIVDFNRHDSIGLDGAHWNFELGSRIDDGSVYVVFVNANQPNELLTAPRLVISLLSPTGFVFRPPLSATEARLVLGTALHPTAFELRRYPVYQVANVAIYTQDLEV